VQRGDFLFSGICIYLLNINRQGIFVFLSGKKNKNHHLIFWLLETLTSLKNQV
jgi:hypothetical protein